MSNRTSTQKSIFFLYTINFCTLLLLGPNTVVLKNDITNNYLIKRSHVYELLPGTTSGMDDYLEVDDFHSMFDTVALVLAGIRCPKDNHQAMISMIVSHKEPVILANRGIDDKAKQRDSGAKVQSVIPRLLHIGHFKFKGNLELDGFLNSNLL